MFSDSRFSIFSYNLSLSLSLFLFSSLSLCLSLSCSLSLLPGFSLFDSNLHPLYSTLELSMFWLYIRVLLCVCQCPACQSAAASAARRRTARWRGRNRRRPPICARTPSTSPARNGTTRTCPVTIHWCTSDAGSCSVPVSCVRGVRARIRDTIAMQFATHCPGTWKCRRGRRWGRGYVNGKDAGKTVERRRQWKEWCERPSVPFGNCNMSPNRSNAAVSAFCFFFCFIFPVCPFVAVGRDIDSGIRGSGLAPAPITWTAPSRSWTRSAVRESRR